MKMWLGCGDANAVLKGHASNSRGTPFAFKQFWNTYRGLVYFQNVSVPQI